MACAALDAALSLGWISSLQAPRLDPIKRDHPNSRLARAVINYTRCLPPLQALGQGCVDGNGADSNLGAAVNRQTHDAALRSVAGEARNRYEGRGRRLHFAPDRRAEDVVCVTPFSGNIVKLGAV